MRLRELFFENLDRTGESKSAVVGYGRGMGHRGHMMLASSVLTQANESGSDPYFVISRTMGKDDPLSPEEKLQIYNKVFPNNPQVFRTATEEMPDLNRVLKKLATMSYSDVTVVVGADQVNAFQYLVRPDKSGVEPYKQFGLEHMKVIARQDTNDPSREQEGPRATPMRDVLMDPNKSEDEKFAVWRDAMSPQLSDQEVRGLMATALQRMQDFNKPKVRAKKEKAVGEEAVGIVTKQHSLDERVTIPPEAPEDGGPVAPTTPVINLTDGNTGTMNLLNGSSVPVTLYPAGGMQPRMPMGSEKVIADLNGQQVTVWVYNGKAYVTNYKTAVVPE